MEKRFEGQVMVVTGAADGLGAAAAQLFARDGAIVLIADVDIARGERTARAIGDAATFRAVDVTKEAEFSAFLEHAVAKHGRLDCLVNNAGSPGTVSSIMDLSEENFDRTIATNLKGTMLGIKHAGRLMRPRGRGAIINIASTAGVLGGLGAHDYTAAKHGVVGLTKSAAVELAAYGIRVNAVAPGGTRTKMIAMALYADPSEEMIDQGDAMIAQLSPLGRAGKPRDIAEAVCFLASDAAEYITGQVLMVDGGQTLPRDGAKTMYGQPAGQRN